MVGTQLAPRDASTATQVCDKPHAARKAHIDLGAEIGDAHAAMARRPPRDARAVPMLAAAAEDDLVPIEKHAAAHLGATAISIREHEQVLVKDRWLVTWRQPALLTPPHRAKDDGNGRAAGMVGHTKEPPFKPRTPPLDPRPRLHWQQRGRKERGGKGMKPAAVAGTEESELRSRASGIL